jgi:prephenate dehydrogenase
MWRLLYSLRFKMFDTIRLIKKIYEICKTICVYESIFNNESNNMKIINNYLNLLNKINSQIRTKKSTVSNILKRMEHVVPDSFQYI